MKILKFQRTHWRTISTVENERVYVRSHTVKRGHTRTMHPERPENGDQTKISTLGQLFLLTNNTNKTAPNKYVKTQVLSYDMSKKLVKFKRLQNISSSQYHSNNIQSINESSLPTNNIWSLKLKQIKGFVHCPRRHLISTSTTLCFSLSLL